MRWNRFRLETITQAEDLVISALSDAGVEGVEIEDNQPLTQDELDQMFVDIMPEGPEDDGKAFLSFYLDEDADCEAILERVREELEKLRAFAQIGPCTIERSQTEDTDWINNWKQYFHQFYVDDILIIPSWETVSEEDKDRTIIHIDPGTAFGTGMHETTQLCIHAIKDYLREGDALLDVGTGSGILSIAALLLGAGSAVGTDLDPCAASAVEENLAANGIGPEKMQMITGNLIDDPNVRREVGTERYDMVTANILADVLIPLMPHMAAAMKKNGVIILSGILEGRENSVAEAMTEAGLVSETVRRQGEWVCLTGRKAD